MTRRFIQDAGGRKFILAVLVVILAFCMSMFGPDDNTIVTKWNDMALIVVGFYFGYKAAESKFPGSAPLSRPPENQPTRGTDS